MIGLMMIRDETDVLEETLRNHTKFCYSILVLDGTEGDQQKLSEDIARSFPQVAGYWRDQDTGLDRPLRDGARQFLLAISRVRWGFRNWHAVLHGDEIWTSDPRNHIVDMPAGAHGGVVALYHFFPHVSERSTWSFQPGISSIESTSRHYMLPPVREERLFFDAGIYDYEVDRHSKVIPPGIRSVDLNIKVKQFNYRQPSQAVDRALSRASNEWQRNHYQHLVEGGNESFFRESLDDAVHRWAASVPIGSGSVRRIEAGDFPVL